MIDNTNKRLLRATRPCPTPPVDMRPNSLAVTDIETWIRDPYALYAKRILKLSPLPPLEREADALLRGTLYHDILHQYVSVNSSERGLETLTEIANTKIEKEKLSSDLEKIWKLRFAEIAQGFVEWEDKYINKNVITETFTEIAGSIELANGDFRLRARADRIDTTETGAVNIIDYKTGLNPSIAQARTLSPQLSLEAAIAKEGGYSELGETEINKLLYLRLRRGKGFKQDSVSNSEHPAGDLIENALNNLLSMIAAYSNPEQGYLSRRAPFREGEVSGDYDHLARTREWAFGEEEDE